MPTVTKFCCCCSLRTGAVILAWIGIVSSGLSLTTVSIILGNLDNIVEKYNRFGFPEEQDFPMIDRQDNLNSNPFFDERHFFDSVGDRSNAPVQFEKSEGFTIRSPAYQALSITLPTIITSCIIGLLGYVLLLIGATRGNRFLLLPWLIMKMTVIVVSSIVFLMMTFVYGIAGIIILFVGLPVIGLILYWWICVLSLFQELRETQSDGMVLVPPRKTTPYITDYTPPPYDKLSEDV